MAEQMHFGLINGCLSQEQQETLISVLNPLGSLELVEQGAPLEQLNYDGYDGIVIDPATMKRIVSEPADLRQKIQVKDDLLWLTRVNRRYAHVIRTHAATILARAQDIRDEPGGVLTEKQKRGIFIIEQLCNQILSYTDKPPLPSNNEGPGLSLKDFLIERVEVWKQAYEGVTFKLVPLPDELLPVLILRDCLLEACDYPVENAVAAMTDSPQRVLTIEARRERNWAVIAFSDTGPGIPPELREKILVTLTPKQGGKQGVGFGLHNAQTIIERFSGKIYVDKTGISGTRIVIQLPLAV